MVLTDPDFAGRQLRDALDRSMGRDCLHAFVSGLDALTKKDDARHVAGDLGAWCLFFFFIQSLKPFNLIEKHFANIPYCSTMQVWSMRARAPYWKLCRTLERPTLPVK